MADHASILDRLKRRRAQLRETRQILAKRSAVVRKRRREQKHARKNLEAAVKHHRPKHDIDIFQNKLAQAHEDLDKALLGRKAIAAREARLQKKVEWLKAHKPKPKTASTGVSTPLAPWNGGHHQIANWIVPWLEKSWSAGWRGTVNSGWRDPAYSTSLCYGICGHPTCSGTCAGASSNHSGSVFPHGAVDVSDYYTFAAVQRRIGSPLHNALPSDRVHFSYYGN